MRVCDALDQIANIRTGIARAEAFRGYRAATTAFNGALSIATATAMAVTRRQDDASYLSTWCAVADVGVGVDVAWRRRWTDSALQRDLAGSAIEHFTPAVTAGGLLTRVLFRVALEAVWTLPGLWMILFGLGVHASRRLLPPFSEGVAGYSVACGLTVPSLREPAAFHP